MARSVRNTKLDSRTARLKLPQRDAPYFASIGKGIALGYRRLKSGNGTWLCRYTLPNGQYKRVAIGQADDHQESDGVVVLTFTEAQKKADTLVKELLATKRTTPITVREAAEDYMAWFKVEKKSVKDTQSVIDTHILPAFGDRPVSELTKKEIQRWRDKLATTPPRRRSSRHASEVRYGEKPITEEAKRARKATANRILTVLKAILNKAYADELVEDDSAWRKVKPFEKVDEPSTRFLTESEATRLINACPADFRALVKAALFTGARYGELIRLTSNDFNPDTGQIRIRPSKSGKGRYIPLSKDGQDFFSTITAGLSGAQLIFTRDDGKPWGKSHQDRRMEKACKNAKIEPPISFHELRHTYASLLAQAGADLLTISKLLGHADTRVTSRHYAHLCDKTLAQTVGNLLPEFGHKADDKVVPIQKKKGG